MRTTKWYAKTGAPGFAVVDEVKGKKGEGLFKLAGVASVFMEVDQGDDRTFKGAFKNVKAPLPLLYQHEYKTRPPVGVVDWVGEDDSAWLFTALIPSDTVPGYEMRRLLELQSLSGISYGYTPVRSRPNYVGDKQVRDLLECDVGEISVVVWPMLKSARIQSWADKSVDEIRDRVLIRKYGDEIAELKAAGIEPHSHRMIDRCDALVRQLQRLQYDGLTEAEWTQKQLREITKDLEELEGLKAKARKLERYAIAR